jgi:hypothetical protein
VVDELTLDSALVQEIGDIDCFVCPGSCLLGEWALAALSASPQLGTLLAHSPATAPLGSDVFRYQVRDRLEQDRPDRKGYGHHLMLELFGNQFWSDVRHD